MPLSLFIQCLLISCRCLLGKLSGREFLRQSTVSSDHIPPHLVFIQYLVPVYDYAETIRTKVTRDSYPAKDQLIWILSGTLLPQNSGKVCLLDVCSLSDWDFPGLFRLFLVSFASDHHWLFVRPPHPAYQSLAASCQAVFWTLCSVSCSCGFWYWVSSESIFLVKIRTFRSHKPWRFLCDAIQNNNIAEMLG